MLLAEGETAEVCQAPNETSAHQEVRWNGEESTFTFWPSSQSGFPVEVFDFSKAVTGTDNNHYDLNVNFERCRLRLLCL